MIVTWVGIIIVARNSLKSRSAFGNLILAKAKAAMDAEINVTSV